jgi:hypothetical protein
MKVKFKIQQRDLDQINHRLLKIEVDLKAEECLRVEEGLRVEEVHLEVTVVKEERDLIEEKGHLSLEKGEGEK